MKGFVVRRMSAQIESDINDSGNSGGKRHTFKLDVPMDNEACMNPLNGTDKFTPYPS